MKDTIYSIGVAFDEFLIGLPGDLGEAIRCGLFIGIGVGTAIASMLSLIGVGIVVLAVMHRLAEVIA